jgi:drug/metabolite transporter (DMT)-like permease
MAPYAWMLAGCFALAWMGQCAHQLKETCDWRVVALARSTLAFVFALVLARRCSAPLVFLRPGALWLRGCASSISLLCTFFALTSPLPTSEVLTLTNTFPIWVALLSWPLLRVRPSLSIWVAAACGVLGVALIQSPGSVVGTGARSAIALSLVAAFTNAIAMLGLHRIKGVHPWAIVAHYSGVSVVFVLGSWMMGGIPDLAPLAEWRTVGLLLAVGLAATVGQLCVTQAFTAGAPARIAVVGLTQVLFALGLDLMFNPATVRPLALAGIALVLIPTGWMMAAGSRKRLRPS